MALIFLSYAREAKESVEVLADDLRALGSEVWLDQELTGGQKWWDHILQRIRECNLFVPVISPQSLESVACSREMTYAIKLHRPILPVLISHDVSVDLLPPSIAQLQVINYQPPTKEALKILSRALLSLPTSVPLPSDLPNPPLPPISYLGSIREQIVSDLTLSFEAQTSLLFRLREGLAEKSKSAEVIKLVERLAERDDLFAKIAREIDVILRAYHSTNSVDDSQPQATDNKTERVTKSPPAISATPTSQTKSNVEANTLEEAVSQENKKSIVLGTCPRPGCRAQIPLDSRECPKCGARFGPTSSWKVIPK